MNYNLTNMKLELQTIETNLVQLIGDTSIDMGLDSDVSSDTIPYEIGIKSHILVSLTSRLEDLLKVAIPVSCYIFYDKKLKRSLTLKEASKKLLKVIKNGK